MAFSLKNLFSKMEVLKTTSTGSAVGVDIGTSAIKVVEIKKKGGKVILETYGAIALGPYADQDIGRTTNLPPEKIVEALKEVLTQSGISQPEAAFALPVQSSLIFALDLPPTIKESDFPSVIPTEARKYIPIAVSEVTLDYFISPKKELSYEEATASKGGAGPLAHTEVIVLALQNDAVTKFRTISSQAALQASFFEIEVFSSIRANFEHELSLVLLVDLGASYTKLSLVEFGMIKSHHTIKRGGVDITDSISRSLSIPFTEAESIKKEFGLLENGTHKEVADIIKVHLDYIFTETSSVILTHERKYGRTLSKVILTGGGALMKGIQEAASNSFRAEVEIGKPFSKVGAPPFLQKVLDALGPEFAVAIGLALRKLQ